MPDELTARFIPVVVGARVGDAMGTPTEGLEPAEIAERFGWVSDFAGDGTDDSLMASMLAEALIATDGRASADAWAAQWVQEGEAIRAKRDKFFISVLHTVQKLRYGWLPSRVAMGNMPSSSSAMAIWPVGLVNAGHPWEAADQAYSLAALIHVGEVDFCQDAAAAMAAAVAAGLRPGVSLREAFANALPTLRPISGNHMRELIASLEMADSAVSGVWLALWRAVICGKASRRGQLWSRADTIATIWRPLRGHSRAETGARSVGRSAGCPPWARRPTRWRKPPGQRSYVTWKI